MRSVTNMELLEDRQLFSIPVTPLVVPGTNGADVISVKLDAAGKNVLWTTNGVNHSYPLAYVSSIIVAGFAGNDLISVSTLKNGLDLSINGGAGSDAIYVGGGKLSYLTSGNITIAADASPNNIPGLDKDSIFINAFDSNIANLSERFDIYADRVHLGGVVPGVGTITGIDVKFTGAEDVRFTAPAQKNALFFVNSVAAFSAMHVSSGWMGNDHIYVGNGDIDKNIAGNLDLNGYYGWGDWVHINDNQALNGHVYNVKDNVLKTLQMRSITLPERANIVLNMTNWGDRLDLDGGYKFGSFKSFNIYGNNGGDELFFGSNTLTLSPLQNVPIYIDPGAGIDRVLMQDGANKKPGVYHLSQGKFSNDFGAKVTFANSTETFAAGGGDGANTFDVVPGTWTGYQLYGHLLSPNSGAKTELFLGLAGVASPKYTSTGSGQGKYTFGNRRSIEVFTMTNLPSLNQNLFGQTKIIAVL